MTEALSQDQVYGVDCQRMLGVLDEAVQADDLDFANGIALGQIYLRPFEVAKYIDQKNRLSTDLAEARRWMNALYAYIPHVKDQACPPEEKRALNAIIYSVGLEELPE
ncbi:MAG: hypothetical protein JWM81_1170 [Candidatus Saccharibacteria bacterium]|nr:hypothetical protein [Candidatus Saccharibacteria bacterium]